MPTQWFAKWTPLDPPVTVDGKVCSLAIKLLDPHSNQAEGGASVVTGTIDSITSLGGNLYRIKCARAYEQCSRTVSAGPGNTFEQIYQCLMGGNVVDGGEARRIYSFVSGSANRGGASRSRALPNDVFKCQGVRFHITDARAFNAAPDEVSWQGENYQITPGYYAHEPHWIQLEAGDDTLVYTPGSADLYSDCAAYLYEPVGGNTLLTRKVFQVGGEDRPELYPADAALALGEYWCSPVDFSFRFGALDIPLGVSFFALYYRKSQTDIAAQTGFPLIVEPSSASAYGSTADAIFGAGQSTAGDFTDNFTITAGAGALDWRWTNAAGAIRVCMTWDATGLITGVRKRTTAGGADEAVAFTVNVPAMPFHVKLQQAWDTFTLSHSPDGVTWTVAASVVLTGVTAADDGLISLVAIDDLKFSSFAGDVQAIGFSRTGWLAAQNLFNETDIVWIGGGYSLPDTTALVEVYDITTSTVMKDNAEEETDGRRDVYSRTGDTIYFGPETTGDNIRITCAARVGTPPKPGDPPRVANIIKFADGGSNVNDNRAHWHDTVTLCDEHGEAAKLAPGLPFEIFRAEHLDPTDPPAILKKSRNVATAWDVFDPANYVLYCAENLMMLCKDYLDGLGASERPCLKFFGVHIKIVPGVSATPLNKLVLAAEVLDELWTGGGLMTGGGAPTLIGSTSPIFMGATQFACVPGWQPSAFTEQPGQKIDVLKYIADINETFGCGVPHWDNSYGGGTGPAYIRDLSNSSALGFPTSGDSPVDCMGDVRMDYAWRYLDGCFEMSLWPDTAPLTPGDPQGFGAFLGLGSSDFWGEFGFQGIPFNPTELFARMPHGTTILEAKAEALFGGLVCTSWTVTYSDEHPAGEYSETVSTGGTVHWTLGARRRSSTFARHYNGNTLGPVPNDQYYSFASAASVGAGVVTGYKRFVDLTAAVQALVNDRDSMRTDYFFWPSVKVKAGSSVSSLANYLETLIPNFAITQEWQGPDYWTLKTRGTVSGTNFLFTSLALSNLRIRYRLLSGWESGWEIFRTRQPHISAFA